MVSTVVAKTFAGGALSAIATIVKGLLTSQKNESLVEFTSHLRVEPMALIDKDLERAEYLPDVLQALLSLFCGYYLQAVACMTNVGHINVVRMLDALNPNRDAGSALSAQMVDFINGQQTSGLGMLSYDAYEHGLPSMKAKPGLEAFGKWDPSRKNHIGTVEGSPNIKDGVKAATESSNLFVGKLLEVAIEPTEGKKAVFPVSVRIAPALVRSDVLVHILGNGGSDYSFRERFHKWRAGEIELVRDLILCEDMIENHKKMIMRDPSGAYNEMARRRATNGGAAALTGTASIASASATVVLTKESATALERQNMGKLSDERFRSKIFKDNLLMFMVIVDTDYESVTVYTRGQALPFKASVREMKATNKRGDTDIGSILQAYRLGNTPTL